jgi:uncharacterized protein GlcG (DUF336 family)
MRCLAVSLIALCVISVQAESWTNAAGHAVSAELVSRKGDVLTMKRENGSTFTIHYKALSKACQKTVDKKLPVVQLSHEDVVKMREEQRMKLLEEKKASRKVR